MKTMWNAIVVTALLGMSLPVTGTAEGTGNVANIVGITDPAIHILFDQTHDLPVQGTFGWGLSLLHIDPALGVKLSDVEDRLHRSLLDALPAEGFTYTNQSPDYLVGFAILVGDSMDEAELNQTYGKLLAFPTRAAGTAPLNYGAGALILDIVEREHGRLLWRGAIMANIDLKLPDDQKQARCDGAIRELLRHYPSPPAARQ